jgi:hypothetical protein
MQNVADDTAHALRRREWASPCLIETQNCLFRLPSSATDARACISKCPARGSLKHAQTALPGYERNLIIVVRVIVTLLVTPTGPPLAR